MMACFCHGLFALCSCFWEINKIYCYANNSISLRRSIRRDFVSVVIFEEIIGIALQLMR